jgi:hypothetical protein
MCALQVGSDTATRQLLLAWQREDGVPQDAGLSDPPLLLLEIEAAGAQLGLLRLLAEDAARPLHNAPARDMARVEELLFRACKANMERFEGPASALEARAASGANGAADAVRAFAPMLSRGHSGHAQTTTCNSFCTR